MPGSYAILFFIASNFTFPSRCIHYWASFPLWPRSSIILELLAIVFPSSPVAYWTASNLRGSSSGVILFAFSYCSWGSPGKNTGVGCHFLLQEIYTNCICVLLLFSQSCPTICVVLYNLFYIVLTCMISLYFHDGLLFLIPHHGWGDWVKGSPKVRELVQGAHYLCTL